MASASNPDNNEAEFGNFATIMQSPGNLGKINTRANFKSMIVNNTELEKHSRMINVDGVSAELDKFKISASYARIMLEHEIEGEMEEIKEKNDMYSLVASQLLSAIGMLQMINFVLIGYNIGAPYTNVVCGIAFAIYPIQVILYLVVHWSRYQATWKKKLLKTLGYLSDRRRNSIHKEG